MAIRLLPKPHRCRIGTKRYDLSKARHILVPAQAAANLKSHFIDFARSVSQAFAEPPGVGAGRPIEGLALLRAHLGETGIPPEGYRLACGVDGAVLTARDEAGLFYGLQTFRQLFAQTGPILPETLIEDYPDFPHRGFMLDVSRCKVPTMDTLFGYIDLLSSLKINHLQLYTEHTFAFSGHEVVWRDASPLTSEEILRLDAYCRARFIELTPNFNSFGHFERWLIHPDYLHLAECPNGYRHPLTGSWRTGSTLKPGRQALALLDQLYGELLPNFAGKNFNVGCDETWELGMGRSSKLCAQRGVTRVYLDFVKKIERLVSGHGRRMMFWGDIILKQPELIRELPTTITALNWGYEADHDFDGSSARFASTGIPFILCPGTSSWNSLLGRSDTCLRNIAAAARAGISHGALGLLTTDWGDNGHHQYKPISYVGVLAGAAHAWHQGAAGKTDIVNALNEFVFSDPTGTLGRVLYDLGVVYRSTGVILKNKTILNDLLFWEQEEPPASARKLTPQASLTVIEELSRLGGELDSARPRCGDGELAKQELRAAVAMARFGMDRFRALHTPSMDRLQMRRRLRAIIAEHERLWLARNRPGGLHESSGKLRAVPATPKGQSKPHP